MIERTAQFLISFPTVGMLVNLDPLLAPIRTGTVLSLQGDRLRLKIEAGLPSSLNSGDEVELSCCDDLDQSLSRRRATLDGAFEESFAFHLLGGVYRTQRRQFFRKEISLPLRYRLAGDFYRVGFAADISGGGVRIQNVTPNAKVGGTIQIELRLAASEPPLTIEGEIVRAAPAPAGGLEIGLAFRQIAPQDKSRLVMFLFGEAIK
ncbi:MAG TPA: hypothetical protein DD435_02720 [Cyanobacteria bacterium UBA8530]|nr:hypothetical protein [Cyanobacteria bacterium UBA8530]